MQCSAVLRRNALNQSQVCAQCSAEELGGSYEEVVAVIEGADRVREPLGRVRREVVDVLERAVVLEQPFDELVVLFSLPFDSAEHRRAESKLRIGSIAVAACCVGLPVDCGIMAHNDNRSQRSSRL